MEIFGKNEKSIVRAMCGVQLKDKVRAKGLMLMLGLNEIIKQFAIAVFIGMVMC